MPERSRFSVVVVEYLDGRVAVQVLDAPRQEADTLFNECKSEKPVRMSIIHIEFPGDTDIITSARAKRIPSPQQT